MNLIDRVKNIIASPNKEWDVIAAEQPDTSKIVTGYVLPLTALAAIAAFIGYGLIGFRILGFRVTGMEWGLYYALTAFIAGIASVYLTALVIDMLAPSFNSEKNFNRSLQLVAYSFTPMWIGGLLSIFPPIALIGSLFGIYGLYLLYLGIPKLKKTPADKHVGYFVVSLIVLIVVYWILVWILHSILLNIFGLSFGFGGFNLNY
jgi:hypothetical protein